jgi:hypothetical protein
MKSGGLTSVQVVAPGFLAVYDVVTRVCTTRDLVRERTVDYTNIKRRGSVAILSATVVLAGGAAITPASAHSLAAPKPYGCSGKNPPKKCQTGTGGVRVTGGANGTAGTTGGTRSSGGASGTGKSGAAGKSGAGANGKSGANAKGAGANGANANGANPNGSSPAPARGLPVTGFGGSAQDLGASARTAAAGTQPVVAGLASSPSAARVAALPATGGGGIPSQPSSPLLAILAGALAALGLGLRKVAARF